MPKKTDKDFAALFVKGLFNTVGWTIVYYLAAWTALLGLGAVGHIVMKRRNAKK